MPLHMAISISRNSGASLTAQIQEFIREEIEEGTLQPATRLPSSRRLAEDLGVSRSVVVEAYAQLVAEGYLDTARGASTRVVRHLPRETVLSPLLDAGHVPSARWDLRTGGHSSAVFPRAEWLAAYQRALAAPGAGDRDDGYPPLAGENALRVELARYLGRAHGVRTAPERIVITGGFAQALSLLGADLLERGVSTLAVEDPGHPGLRHFIHASGLRPCPVPVDEEGIDVERLADSGARAVLVTPAHQFPTGITLTPARREALARWARERDGWIIEDDYDGGLWYDPARTRPLALQRLVPERVIYAGTASKTLSPGLRLGWLAAPEPVLSRLLRLRARLDLGSESLSQRAFAELLRGGLFDRHLRRLNKLNAVRRAALDEAVRRHLPGARVLGPAAGLHAYVRLPRHTDEAALVAGALRRSVLVRGGAAFHTRPRRDAPALVLGHARLPRTGVADAVRELAARA
ncbi:PLP-dependent aminotransferase family protein [Streptomyces xiamenensis]|uniref:MocR-like pyridoxine biosynthesis transcription factor PdxR n=1 Tax=Streptomyces xiamenensis TaxID=408015 RepID=UPI0036CF4EDE